MKRAIIGGMIVCLGVICIAVLLRGRPSPAPAIQSGVPSSRKIPVKPAALPTSTGAVGTIPAAANRVAIHVSSNELSILNDPRVPEDIRKAIAKNILRLLNGSAVRAGGPASHRRVTAAEVLNAAPDMPAQEKSALFGAFIGSVVGDSTMHANYVESAVSRIVGDSKYNCKKELAAIDVTDTPPEFAETVRKLVDAYAVDDQLAENLLRQLSIEAANSGPDPAVRGVVGDVLGKIYKAVGKQKESAAAGVESFTKDYVRTYAGLSGGTQSNIGALETVGASQDFVKAYENYAEAVATGDLEAISWTSWEMRYLEYRDDFLAQDRNLDSVGDEQMDEVLGILAKNVYDLDRLYGGKDTEKSSSSQDSIAAVDSLLYAKFVSDTKDYRTLERRVPDHEYSDKLAELETYLDSCPEDFKESYSNHLVAWDKLDYANVGTTWSNMVLLTDNYKLHGTYSDEWGIDTNRAATAPATDEQRLAMEAVMQADHDLTEARNREIAERVGNARLNDITQVSLTNCPEPVAGAYEEFVGANIYNFDVSSSTSAPVLFTNESPESVAAEIVTYASNKVEAAISEYLSSTTTNGSSP